MEDFAVDIKIDVHHTDVEDTHIKTLNASVLKDETLTMIMEDVAMHLNKEDKNGKYSCNNN